MPLALHPFLALFQQEIPVCPTATICQTMDRVEEMQSEKHNPTFVGAGVAEVVDGEGEEGEEGGEVEL